MFLVDKTHLTSHFKLLNKKPSSIPKTYQLLAQSFDEKIILHLKTLNPASDSSIISLTWMSKAVTFLSTVHFEAQNQISSLRSETDYYQDLYMDYSQKVLDLLNLISSAVKQLIERRLLLNLSLRLINSSGQIPSPEKLKKAKDVLIRSVQFTEDVSKDKSQHVHDMFCLTRQDTISKEKSQRAKELLEELSSGIKKLPIGKISNGRDLICRTLHGLGALTVFVAGVLVTVLYGQSDLVEVRVPAEFVWADSVNGVQKQIFEMMKLKQVLEVEDTVKRAQAVCDVIDDGDGGEDYRRRLEDGVKELVKAVGEFSDGVDKLTNGVNGLFSSVLKTRNGVLDGVRKSDW